MKNNPFTGKSTRTKIFTVISIVAILLLLVLNLWVAKFGIFGNAYIDLTPEGLYTLTPEMEEACEDIFYMSDGSLRDPGITITFCDDPDNIIDNLSTRVTYYMAVALSRKFDNCEVENVNVNMNPTAVAKYRTTSLTQITSNDVIVSYGSRYRIVSADSFWRISSDNVVYSYDGEYKLASVLLSLTLVDRPAAYFVTDHEETYYDVENPNNPMNAETGMLVDLLGERGFEVKNLSISKLIEDAEAQSAATGKTVIPEIPEDCVLLIINNPKKDFTYDATQSTSFAYVSETEVLDRYMTDERGSIMVSLDYDPARLNNGGKRLENLEDFLSEWGIDCTGLKVTDTENSVENIRNDDATIITDYNLEEDTYAYDIYGDFASMTSAPRFVVDDTGSLKSSFGLGTSTNEQGASKVSRIFAPFLYSSSESQAYAKSEATGDYVNLAAQGRQIIAAIGSRQNLNSETGNRTHSYVFCAASPVFFSTDFLGNTSYANFDIVSALVQDISRLDTFADDSLGGMSINNDDDSFLGKKLVDTTIRSEDTSETVYEESGEESKNVEYGLTSSRRNVYIIIIFALPLLIAIAGTVVCIKRKYL